MTKQTKAILKFMLFLLFGCVIISLIAQSKTLSVMVMGLLWGWYLGTKLSKEF